MKAARSGRRARSRDGATHPQGLWEVARAQVAPWTLTDAGIFIGVVLIFALSFQQLGDISHTIGCSGALLEGHWADFYEFNTRIFKAINYLPTTYLVYAAWGVPLKVLGLLPPPGQALGGIVFWYKLLNAAFYVAAALAVRRIAQQLGASTSRSNLIVGAWLASPLAFFSTFIFGQYDIITACIFLWAMHFYLQGRLVRFAAITSIAVTFKYMPIFAFAPMLLAREKNFFKIVACSVLCITPAACEIALYIHDPTFVSGVLNFEPAKRLFGTALQTGYWSFSLGILSWAVLCASAYLYDAPSPEEGRAASVYFAMAGAVIFFLFTFWHPQWLIFLTPFVTLAACFHKKTGFFFFVDAVTMMAFVVLVVKMFPGNVDSNFWGGGVWSGLQAQRGNLSPTIPMARFPGFATVPVETLLGIFNGSLIVYLMHMAPRLSLNAWLAKAEPIERRELNAVWWRLALGVGAWAVPALYAF